MEQRTVTDSASAGAEAATGPGLERGAGGAQAAEADDTGAPRRWHDPQARGFASDNCAGVHPEVLAALAVANGGHVTSYGADPYTDRLQEVIRGHFGPAATAYPVFNGTGANVVSLGLLADRWDAAICTSTAHVDVDECGAPERVAGVKLLPVPTPDGKLTPELVATRAIGFGFEHHAEPRIVTITQSTELGTIYTPDEIAALCRQAHELGMVVHVDGARIANAAAALGCTLREMLTDTGVDVVSLGGTKNGALAAEAVVVLTESAVRRPLYVRKLMTQLPSKMRFVSAQLLALYEGDLWLRSAAAANAAAARLAAGIADLDGIEVTQQVQANEVFVILPAEVTARLRERFEFYDWNEATGEVRFVCSYDTTAQDVDAFVAALRAELTPAMS